MPYKRPNQGAKKFLPSYGPKKTDNESVFSTGYGSDSINIPMPNEREGFKHPLSKGKGLPGVNSILDFIKVHIRVEEIILIGLIILLLDESIEDDFLLIILVYILLF